MSNDLTDLIAGSASDPVMRDALLARVYRELQQLARRELRGSAGGQTLSTGPLVHEAYLKLFPRGAQGFESRSHFFGAAARAMRQVVVDYARARLAASRNHGVRALNLDDVEAAQLSLDSDAENWVQLDAALERLEEVDERALQIAEMRYFAGMDIADIASALNISEPTVKRDCRFVRAFLVEALGV